MLGRLGPWFFLFASVVLPVSAPLHAANLEDTTGSTEAVEAHLVSHDAGRIRLAHPFVVPGSVDLRVLGSQWTQEQEYRLDAERGIILFQRHPGDGEAPDVSIVVRYRYVPAPLPINAELHEITSRPSHDAADPVPDRRGSAAGRDAQIPLQDLNVRGSKSIRMSSGSRRELTVDQTLRLNISGRLTEDISVLATLSDDNLPVVPEGNTEELRDIDKVRVELNASNWRAVLGDFVAGRKESVFGGYRRKLQGAQLEVRGGGVEVDALAGAPRGRYRTMQIRGEESNQGPYPLGGDGVANLFIVAASERVTVDGTQLTRGADRDYVIDYVRGTLSFTYRRLITAESEIVVEFEEGEGPFARSVAGVGTGGGFGSGAGRTRLSVSMIQEQDDSQRPRLGELSDEDRVRLEAAGDDINLAVTDGVTEVEPGEGRYRLEELGGMQIAVWDTLAGDVNVDFYNVGSGVGDYSLESLTSSGEQVFAFQGVGAGAWRIGRPLPLPTRQRLISMTAAAGDSIHPWLDAEWHLSSLDANTLSDLDDGDNDGRAWRLGLHSGKRQWRSLGTFEADLTHEDLGHRFMPFLLVRDLFRYERWGLGDRAKRAGFLEERDATSRGEFAWSSRRDNRHHHRLALNWDRLSHGESLRANAAELDGEWKFGILGGRHGRVEAKAEDGSDPLDVERIRDLHVLNVELGPVVPEISWERDRFEDDAATAASTSGARLRRWRGALASTASSAWDWRLSLSRDLADSLHGEDWRRERDGRTWEMRVGTPSMAGMRLTGDGTLREVSIPEGADLRTRLGNVRLNGRWPLVGSDWGLSYGIDNSRSEVLDRQILYVGERQGDYNQNGDFMGFEQGDHQVVTVGTDSLVATTEVRADLTWRQDFGFLGKDRLWGGWSTYTRLSARGRSRADDVSSLMRLRHGAIFSDQDAVLGETSLRQDVNLLRHIKAWDLRFTLEADDRLDRQYATHPERRLRRLQTSTLSHHPIRELSLKWRLRHEDDRRETEETLLSSNRSYLSDQWRHEGEVQWTTGPGNQLSLRLDHTRRNDAVSGVVQREWGLKPSARWKLAARWSGNAELRWFNVDSEEPEGAIRPFFYAYPGANVDAAARLNWEPTRTMTIALSLISRRLGEERGWQHDVRMESTARF